MVKKNYLDHIVHLRGVMILLVVLGHVLSIFIGDYAQHQTIESTIGSAFRAVIYSFHMPVFMAISGYLYFFEVQIVMPNKALEGYGKFVGKKFKRLLIPFVIALYLWRKPLFFLSDTSVYNSISAIQMIKDYLSFSTTGALWFLYTLFAIFVAQRIFAKILWKSDKTVLVWFFVFAFVNVAAYRFSGLIHHVMLYNFYFFIGILIHRYQEWIDNKEHIILLVSGIVAAAGTIGLLTISFIGLAGTIYSTVLVSTDIILAFTLSEKLKNIGKKVIGFFSDFSKGIYLFHEPLIVAVGSKLPCDMCGRDSC